MLARDADDRREFLLTDRKIERCRAIRLPVPKGATEFHQRSLQAFRGREAHPTSALNLKAEITGKQVYDSIRHPQFTAAQARQRVHRNHAS